METYDDKVVCMRLLGRWSVQAATVAARLARLEKKLLPYLSTRASKSETPTQSRGNGEPRNNVA